MKRLFSLAMLAMAAFPCAVNAQNIQVHYDLGHSLYNLSLIHISEPTRP